MTWRCSGAWILILFAFLVFELMVVVLPAVGDTLSETVWAFLHDEPARGMLAMGFAWLLLIRLVEIGQPGQVTLSWIGDVNLGRLLLAVGIGGWLTLHWAVAEWERLRRDSRDATTDDGNLEPQGSTLLWARQDGIDVRVQTGDC